MLQRQPNHYELLRRSFMLTSLAAAVLLISMRGQVVRSDQSLPLVLPAIAVPPPPPPVRTVPRIQRIATLSQRDLPRSALSRITTEVRRVRWGLDGARIRTQLVVDLSDRRVSLYKQGRLVTEYPVAIGQTGWETPTGLFQVRNMNMNPTWQHPITGEIVLSGRKNPLGSRWIGFWSDGTNEIGFHGTNESDLIGLAVSHGCIRMLDEDIEQIYAQIRIGTSVAVQP